MAAACFDIAEEQRARTILTSALPGRAKRLHWRNDSFGTRKAAVAAVALLNPQAVVFVQLEVPAGRQERHRQHAMWSLVVELRERHAHDLTFEARERKQDDRDKSTLTDIARSGVGGPTFRYTFGRPLDEPLLWVPDIILGIAGGKLAEKDTGWWDSLEVKPERLVLPPAP